MELQENVLIKGRYRLLEERGRGSFGEVWRARDEVTGGEVAVKMLIGLDRQGQQVFAEEFKIANALNHPNLLHTDYYDIYENRPFVVMPYCPDSSLSLAGKMDEETAWKFLREVAAGLAYLHENGIIHRDIKPANILRDRSGRFLIADFGISTRMRDTLRRNSTRQMQLNDNAGTIPYMAPELFSSMPKATAASDIWAFGASLYELIMGELPFCGQGGVMQKQGADVPVIPLAVSLKLKSVVSTCLAADPANRPAAKQLMKGLETVSTANQSTVFHRAAYSSAAGSPRPSAPTQKSNNPPVSTRSSNNQADIQRTKTNDSEIWIGTDSHGRQWYENTAGNRISAQFDWVSPKISKKKTFVGENGRYACAEFKSNGRLQLTSSYLFTDRTTWKENYYLFTNPPEKVAVVYNGKKYVYDQNGDLCPLAFDWIGLSGYVVPIVGGIWIILIIIFVIGTVLAYTGIGGEWVFDLPWDIGSDLQEGIGKSFFGKLFLVVEIVFVMGIFAAFLTLILPTYIIFGVIISGLAFALGFRPEKWMQDGKPHKGLPQDFEY